MTLDEDLNSVLHWSRCSRTKRSTEGEGRTDSEKNRSLSPPFFSRHPRDTPGKTHVASGGPVGTRMRVRVVVYACRLAVNLAVRYSPRWIGPEIVPLASVPAKMNVIELPGR